MIWEMSAQAGSHLILRRRMRGMPKIAVIIKYDRPESPYWLNPDNVALALHAYCKNTKFEVTWAKNGDPWKKKE
jgi:hypothetical protein